MEQIRSNSEYKYGQGSGPTFDAAFENALEDLTHSIFVFVQSSLSRDIQVENSKENSLRKEEMYRNLSTYSFGTFQDVERIDYGEEPNARVFVYVSRGSIDEMFKNRLLKIHTMIDQGVKEEERFKVADALRYYSWALCLLRTYPDGDAVTFNFQGKDEMAKLWLNSRISELLTDVKVNVLGVEKYDDVSEKQYVSFQFSYKGELVDNFAFHFHNGNRYIGPIYCSDGHAVAEFPGEIPKELLLKVEYLFRSQAQTLDPTLYLVMEQIEEPKFAMAKKTIRWAKGNERGVESRKARGKKTEVKDISALAVGKIELASLETNRVKLSEVIDEVPYQQIISDIANAVRNKKYSDVREHFTDLGYEMFQSLVNNGEAVLLDIPELKFISYGLNVICRSLPMQFKFRNNRQFVNDVIFRFNEEKKIESLSFALTRRCETDIFSINKKWKEDWRMALISFLEDYQTAYALRRMDYLRSVFSEDALIVTGTVLKHRSLVRGEVQVSGVDSVVYKKYTKEQYLKKLEYVFGSKEFINLRLNEIDIVKGTGPRDGIFALQVSQDYYSNNYGDSGYLTLLVDLREEFPIIKVRVWQEGKDTDFTARKLLNM